MKNGIQPGGLRILPGEAGAAEFVPINNIQQSPSDIPLTTSFLDTNSAAVSINQGWTSQQPSDYPAAPPPGGIFDSQLPPSPDFTNGAVDTSSAQVNTFS